MLKFKKMVKNPVLIIVFTLISLLVAYAVFLSLSKKIKVPEEKVWTVQTQVLKKGRYHPKAVVYGVVETYKRATLRSAVNAEVLSVLVKEGQSVIKGELIAKLEKDFFQYQVDEQKAEANRLEALKNSQTLQNKIDLESIKHDRKLIALSRQMKERHAHLKKRNLSSQAQVDGADKIYLNHLISLKKTELAVQNHPHRMAQLNAQLARAKAQLKKAQLDLDDTEVRAPFEGKIINVFIAAGDRLAAHAPIVSLYDLKTVEVRAQMTDKLRQLLAKALKRKQKITAVLEPDINVKLSRIDSNIDAGDSNVDAFFSVNAKDAANLPLGLTVEMRLTLPAQKAVYQIPQVSLYRGNTVYLIKDNRLHAARVKRLGESEEGGDLFYLVTGKELSEGDSLLTTKLPFVREGLKVVVVNKNNE